MSVIIISRLHRHSTTEHPYSFARSFRGQLAERLTNLLITVEV
jgi:hypothetical protein